VRNSDLYQPTTPHLLIATDNHCDYAPPRERAISLHERQLFWKISGLAYTGDERIVKDPRDGDIDNPVLLEFFKHWQSLDPIRKQPRKRDLNLAELYQHVPYIFVNDFDPLKNRFFTRFVGSGYVNEVGVDFTGKFADEVENTEKLRSRMMIIVESKRPYLVNNMRILWNSKDFKSYHSIGCPLFDDNGEVSALIFRLVFQQ
jgi:hypothetical protein